MRTLGTSRMLLLGVAVAALSLGGPVAAQGDAEFAFADVELHLASIDGQPLPAGVVPTATFGSDGQVTGNAGCNSFFGGYQVDGGSITVDELASTLRMCEPAAMEVEKVYLEALQVAETWSAGDDGLTIAGASGELVFRLASASTPSGDLTGVEWTLVSMGGDAIPGGVVVTATFGDDGEVSGQGGCNRYFGPYSTDGDSISVEMLAGTRMMCEPPAMEVEAAFLGAMQAATAWSIAAGELILEGDAEGAAELRFTAGSAAFAGGSWRLRSIDGEEVPGDVEVTLDVAGDGSLGGNGGCNRYFGSYTVDGSDLTISEIGSTLMFCEGPGSEVETAYLAALGATTGWQIAPDGTLVLTGGAELTFEPLAGEVGAGEATVGAGEATAGTPMAGTTWVLSAMAGMAFSSQEPTSLVFAEDGSLGGNTGCNDYFGTYELDGDTLAVGDLGSTRKLCADPMAMTMEQAILELLPSMTRWQIEGDELILADDFGALTLTFTAS
jgi:heat shock protein HslJ